METKNIGLRGIEVADTKISNIDGEKGKLIYRGFDILDLTKNSTFEETAYLLLYDKLPTKQELNEFNLKLVEARYIPKQMQKNMANWRKDADPMDMLQAFVKKQVMKKQLIFLQKFQLLLQVGKELEMD